MGIFSAKFINNSNTSKDPSFKLARENTIKDKNMDQSSDTSLQEQMAILQQLVKQQAEQLNLLQQQANAINTCPQPQSEPQPAVTRPCLILPDPDTFDGSDHALYPEFWSKLDAKLTLDQAALDSYHEMLWYAYYCLSDAAAEQILSWLKIYAKLDEVIIKEQIDAFFDHLDFIFLDKSLQKKALQRLNSIHQGKRSFQELLAEFQRLLMEAGGHAWDDTVKIDFFNEAMNWEMKDRMMSVKTDKGFEPYCHQLQEIINKLDEVQQLANPWNMTSVKHPMLAPHSNPASQSSLTVTTDMMDWESSTQRNRNTQQRWAKWIDDKEYQQQRSKEVCLCCDSAAHQIHTCLFLPACWPQLHTAKVKIANLSDAVLEEEDGHETSILGKE